MAEVIDFKTKKKVVAPPAVKTNYKDRLTSCLETELLTGKVCKCETCVTKRLLASRLVTISNWLCLDYMDKNKGQVLYWGDWLDIMTIALIQVQNTVTTPKSK